MSPVELGSRLIPGGALNPGIVTIASRRLESVDAEERWAVLAIEHGVQYIVWTLVSIPGGVEGGQTVNGTYLRLFGDDVPERLFLRAFAEWLGRL